MSPPDDLPRSSTRSATWQRGEVVEGLYEVREVITSGGMGLVHRVFHRQWNVDLAVKTPNAAHVKTAEQIRNFQAEGEAWVQLGLHPHIVACIYVREIDYIPRVFAEWMDGGSLHDAVRSRRLYNGSPQEVLARILDIAIQFAWGLAHAHASGLIHQDVKPANLMLTSDGVAKVNDFGLAKARRVTGSHHPRTPDGGTVLATFAGMTPAYCSPEQAHAPHLIRSGRASLPLTRATDVWSWAISVWQMFTGSTPVPHGGQLAGETFAHYREDLNVWRDDHRIPPMPPPVAELLSRCFDPNPLTRPRDLDQLAKQLAAIYRDVTARSYPRATPAPATLVADGLNNHALSMLDLGRPEQAEHLWKQALASDPHNVDAVYNYGLHRWRTGQITDEDLLAELEAVRATDPGRQVDEFLAQVHLERYDPVAARDLLVAAASQAPDDRRIAERLDVAHQQAGGAATRSFTEGIAGAYRLAMSADGRIAVTGGAGATLHVWDVATGDRLHTLTGHFETVGAMAVSADGRTAIFANGNALQVWDLSCGRRLRTLEHKGPVGDVAIAADGRVALTSGKAVFSVWDLATGVCLRNLTHDANFGSAALSADGRTAIIEWGSEVRAWDLPTGVCTSPLFRFTCNCATTEIAVSADGRVAVCSGGWDGNVHVLDPFSGAFPRTLKGHTSAVDSLAISGDGRTGLTGSVDDTVRVWDLASGACLRTFQGHHESVSGVAISADARIAVSIGKDPDSHIWQIPIARENHARWSYARGQNAGELLAGAAEVAAAARRAEEFLSAADAAAAAEQLRAARSLPGHRRNKRLMNLWRQLAGKGKRGALQGSWPQHILAAHTGSVESVAVTEDGRIAVSCGDDETVRVWDLADGACLHTLTGHTRFRSVRSVAVSADGRLAVSGGDDGMVRVWDLRTGTSVRVLRGPFDTVNSLALSRNGHTAVCAVGGSIHVFDVVSGTWQRELVTPRGVLRSLAVSADGRTALTGGSDMPACVWDLTTGECVHVLNSGSWHVALSGDNRIALSCDVDDTISVWDVVSGTRLHSVSCQTGQLTSVAFSGDARAAVTVRRDGALDVWDLAAGRRLQTLIGHTASVWSVAMSADAHVVVSAGEDKTVRAWMLDWDYEFPSPATAGGAGRYRDTP